MNQINQDLQTLSRVKLPPVNSLAELRRHARLKYLTFTAMAEEYGVRLSNLSDALASRVAYIHIIARLQNEFSIPDDVVLKLWPQLGRWPRPGLAEHVAAREARLRGAA